MAATDSGAFAREIIPVPVQTADGPGLHQTDEGIRRTATLEGITGVKLLQEGGVISAANASQMCDGASGVLVASEAALKSHNLTPLARIHNLTVTGGDPVIMLEEPIAATRRALKRAGMRIEDIDLYEVNEAFAPIPSGLAAGNRRGPAQDERQRRCDALGHPLGASGAKLMSTLVHALHARGWRYGLQTMCEGGGIANVTIIEAL